MIFAAICVPDFPVAALVRTEPELRNLALAVVEGTPPLLNVVGRNHRARRCGVEFGMTAMQAEERLAFAAEERSWQIRRRSRVQEQAAQAALLDCAYGFSPRVEETSGDTVLLDLEGTERLLGPPTKVARELAKRVREIGLESQVAIAGNPDAAMHAARGFSGVTIIPAGQEAERLAVLPVAILGDTAEGGGATPVSQTLETLDRWGIRNFGQLAALPATAVAQRLGQEGVRWQQLARGKDHRTLRLAEPPLTFQEAVELEYPVAMLEPLAFLLNRMLEQLCARLAGRALAAQELRLRMELDTAEDPEDFNRGSTRISADQINNADPSTRAAKDAQRSLGMTNSAQARAPVAHERETFFARTIKLPVPMLDGKVFLKLLELDLQAHSPGAPVLKIWLEAEPAEPRRAQSGLFVPVAPEPEKLELTLARIKAAVSHQPSAVGDSSDEDSRVGSPEVLDTHRPDAFRMKKFNPFQAQGPSTRAATAAALAQDDKHVASCRAAIADRQPPIAHLGTRIFRPPLAVGIELCGGRPAKLRTDDGRLTIRNREPAILEVLWSAGPWRSSGEWWTEQPWAREEWDVALKHRDRVALYRIYREQGGGWFVEAEYD